MSDCIFCKIIAGQLPVTQVYEDDEVVAFHDIRPIAPVHFMLVPKQHIASLMQCSTEHQILLGKIILLIPQLAKAQGLEKGFKTGINTGKAGGQEVLHLHVHVFGHPQWQDS